MKISDYLGALSGLLDEAKRFDLDKPWGPPKNAGECCHFRIYTGWIGVGINRCFGKRRVRMCWKEMRRMGLDGLNRMSGLDGGMGGGRRRNGASKPVGKMGCKSQ